MSGLVFDASALLAVIFNEPGAGPTLELLARPGGMVSAVSWSEVEAKLAERGLPAARIAPELAALGLQVIPFDAAQAIVAAALRPATRKLGLSLGDRCCLALARSRNARAITADNAWLKLDHFDVVSVRAP